MELKSVFCVQMVCLPKQEFLDCHWCDLHLLRMNKDLSCFQIQDLFTIQSQAQVVRLGLLNKRKQFALILTFK